MNAAQFKTAVERLGCRTHEQAAELLGIGRMSVIRYAGDVAPVPESVRRLIHMFTKYGVPEELRS